LRWSTGTKPTTSFISQLDTFDHLGCLKNNSSFLHIWTALEGYAWIECHQMSWPTATPLPDSGWYNARDAMSGWLIDGNYWNSRSPWRKEAQDGKDPGPD
jgi:hypothetical protein